MLSNSGSTPKPTARRTRALCADKLKRSDNRHRYDPPTPLCAAWSQGTNNSRNGQGPCQRSLSTQATSPRALSGGRTKQERERCPNVQPLDIYRVKAFCGNQRITLTRFAAKCPPDASACSKTSAPPRRKPPPQPRRLSGWPGHDIWRN